ncbi:MAG TPA: SMC family ATPase [Dehalococcoidia bacterium]|nr:SMC family ATPase [Dehalococcoidia bacterium]
MRPIRLTLEGFTCYRRRVEVDFSDLDLFAITGPTGAGKSSLVDAMTYALYGQAPRVRNQVRDLISQGAERMRVAFEFESGGRRYRVARSTARRGHADVQLEEMDPETGQWLPKADRRVDVNQLVRDIVGMDYEGFVRSVVLPQGRFHLFLAGGREERDRVLEDLLGLDLYRAVMQRANDLAQRAQAQAEELARRLGTELAHATPDRLRELRSQALALKREQARLSHLARTAQEALDAARRLAEARQRLASARARLREARQRAEDLSARLVAADGQVSRLEDALARLREELEAVPFSADEYARVHADLQRARDAEESSTRLEALERELAEAGRSLAEARSRVEAARHALQQAQAEASQAEEAWAEAQGRLSDARQRRAAVEQASHQWQESAHALAQAREELDRREGELAEARWAAEEAEAVAREAQDMAQKAQARLLGLRQEHAAHELRRNLRPGQPCPVCGQRVASPPAPGDVAAALAEAEEEAGRCEALSREAREAQARAAARLEGAARALEMARARLQQEEERHARALAALGQAQGEEGPPQEALAAASRAVREAEAEVEARAGALEAARRRLDAARQEFQAAAQAEARLLSRLQALERQRDELAARVGALRESLGAEASPEALWARLQELEQAKARLEALRQDERELAGQLRDRQAERARLREEMAALDAQASLAQAEQEEASQQVGQLAPSLAALLREMGWEQVAQSLAEGGDAVPLLSAQLRQHADELQEVGRRLGALEKEAERLEQDLDLAARLREQAEEAQLQARVARALGDLLRSDRFQAFLRQEALSLLAEDGSRHLRELSRGRYGLVVRRDEFYIQDHWNGDEERPVNTLSGGETFLASLSLALALAEGLPGLAHASRRGALESLFVDEGFSHLDDETLDVVASALEVLGGPGERMVGIITHVPALAERMPARLRVEKSPEGSSVVKD